MARGVAGAGERGKSPLAEALCHDAETPEFRNLRMEPRVHLPLDPRAQHTVLIVNNLHIPWLKLYSIKFGTHTQ